MALKKLKNQTFNGSANPGMLFRLSTSNLPVRQAGFNILTFHS